MLDEGCSSAFKRFSLIRKSETESFPRAFVPVVEYRDGATHLNMRSAICEKELTLVVNGDKLVTLLCSGVALRELAYGFLYSEGVISRLSDVRSCMIDELAENAEFDLTISVRKPDCPVVSSGFGGKTLQPLSPCSSRFEDKTCCHGGSSTVADVMKAVGVMRSFACEYTITRGIHCSALFTDGVPVASFEDIGRHNTFDKLVGRCLLASQSAQGSLLTTTGRISGEMVRKALRLGVSGIASLSGPTDKAISMAQSAGILLAGYVNDASAVVYTGLD